MTDEMLLEHVAGIVSAHVSNNSVSSADLPTLIQSVYSSLVALGSTPEPLEETRQPAVSVRSSVKPDAVTCLECGVKLTMLKRHLATDHGLSPPEYRARWSLAATYPLVAPNYTAKRKELAARIGLGRKGKEGALGKMAATKAHEAAPAAAKAVALDAQEVPAPKVAQRKPRKKLGAAFATNEPSGNAPA